MTHYRTALQIQPNYARAHYALGNALAARCRLDEAIARFQQAVELEPEFAEAHCNLGAALQSRGRIDEALAHYRKALVIKPDYGRVRYNIGTFLAGRQQFDEAITQFQQALKLKPDYVDAHHNLAWLLATCPQASMRNGTEAIAHAQRANQLCGARSRRFSTHWRPPMPKRGDSLRPWPQDGKPWNWPGNKTNELWLMPCTPGSHCTKLESPIISRRRLPHRRNLDRLHRSARRLPRHSAYHGPQGWRFIGANVNTTTGQILSDSKPFAFETDKLATWLCVQIDGDVLMTRIVLDLTSSSTVVVGHYVFNSHGYQQIADHIVASIHRYYETCTNTDERVIIFN